MVTSPADQRSVTDAMNPAQTIWDQAQVPARVWGDLIESVSISFDRGSGIPMRLMVTARTEGNRSASDTILVLVNRSGQFESSIRRHWQSRRERGPSRRERARQPR